MPQDMNIQLPPDFEPIVKQMAAGMGGGKDAMNVARAIVQQMFMNSLHQMQQDNQNVIAALQEQQAEAEEAENS